MENNQNTSGSRRVGWSGEQILCRAGVYSWLLVMFFIIIALLDWRWCCNSFLDAVNESTGFLGESAIFIIPFFLIVCLPTFIALAQDLYNRKRGGQ